MYSEDGTFNLSTIIHNNNSYPREGNNGGYYSSAFLTDNRHLCDTVIPENTYLISNKTPEIKVSVLSSLHISVTKYSI